MVDLVLIHGPPASGKLTIANQLKTLIGLRVFHNHLTIDVAKALFDFGGDGFWELVHELRLASLRSHFEYGSKPAVTTWCYEEPEDLEMFEKIRSIAASSKGRVLPVFLNCDEKSLESRVGNQHRIQMKKLTDVEQLRAVLANKNYRSVPDELCIELDSSLHTAESNAQKIITHFNL